MKQCFSITHATVKHNMAYSVHCRWVYCRPGACVLWRASLAVCVTGCVRSQVCLYLGARLLGRALVWVLACVRSWVHAFLGARVPGCARP